MSDLFVGLVIRHVKRILYLLLLAAPAFAGDVAVRPAPAWAQRVEATEGRVPRDEVRWGIYGILTDHQVRVADGGVVEYFRRVRKVLSPTAVQNASEVSIDFDPSFQRLVLHEVVLIRGAARVNQLDPANVRVIEKESEADQDIYDGSLTALLFLNDVRPGDVIDYSYSLEGSNPLLGATYADEFDFSSQFPVRLMRHRVIAPASRAFHWRASLGTKPAIERNGGEQIVTWQRQNIVAEEVEGDTPEWYDPWETLQVTEYATWHDVALWADALFRADAASRAAVHELAQKIRREHRTHDAQLAAAIRFVQDDIRYLGIEMGRNSHEPHQPAATLAQRYGDCKDKAFLLSLLLRELGAEAYPALVNTKLRRRLDVFLPSPFLFDHVITQVIDGGRTYWVDATIADQGGTLATIDTPNDERALVVRGDATALTKIGVRSGGTLRIARTYTARDFTSPVVLDVVARYDGGRADEIRAKLATQSASELAKQEINRYAADAPNIAAAGAPRVDDDRLHNVVTIRERYSIRGLWRDGAWTYIPREIAQHLQRPEQIVRTMPLSIDYPLDVAETMTIHFPSRLRVAAENTSVTTLALRYERRVEVDGRTIVIRDALRATADSVPVARVAEHVALLNDTARALGVTISSRRGAVGGWEWGTAGLVAFVGGCTSLAVRRRRSRRRPAGWPSAVPARAGGGDAALASRPEAGVTLHVEKAPLAAVAEGNGERYVQR
jgi:Domain of Unknown Function with PDB structure (DUF3857)/Transglutaminase-like superfamily